MRHTPSFSLSPPPPLPLSCTWGCAVISSLSHPLYSPEQQALNQARQKAHWDPTAGACLSWMCHNTGVLSWGVQPSSNPPSLSLIWVRTWRLTWPRGQITLDWFDKIKQGEGHMCLCVLRKTRLMTVSWIVIEWHVVHMWPLFKMVVAQMQITVGFGGSLTSMIKVEPHPHPPEKYSLSHTVYTSFNQVFKCKGFKLGFFS